MKTETNLDPKSRHYDHGGLETLDIIKAKLTPEQYRGFLLGNVIKYSCRANFKGDFDRDMEKVGFYNRFLREDQPAGCANIPPISANHPEDPHEMVLVGRRPVPGSATPDIAQQVEDLGLHVGSRRADLRVE